MVDFSDRDSAKRWFDAIEPDARRREVAIVIAARAALRVAPLAFEPSTKSKQAVAEQLSVIVFPVWRAAALPWVAAKNPIHGNELRNAALAAAAFAEAPIAATTTFASVAAANTAASAANAADAAAGLDAAAFADAAIQAAATVIGAFAASGADAAAIDAGRSPAELASAPLWPEGAPARADKAWRDLRFAMLADHEDWRVWIDWYEARLAGAPANDSLELARALIDDEIWNKGPRAVNAGIARLITEHEALKPRLAAFRFQVVGEKIDAAPVDARPLDAETANEFYNEVKVKAATLRKSLERAQADENLRAHLDRLVKRLGESYVDLQLGLMISALRSLESDVRAYDSEEGRKELSAANLSQIVDVTATLRDLCATFPILREIEVEAVSYDLPTERLPEIRQRIESTVEIVNRSEGVTENGREAINASAEDVTNQRSPSEEARQSAYFLVDFAEFARSGLRHLKRVGGTVSGEFGGLGADSWKALRRGVPKGVEHASKAAAVGGVGALMHWLGSDIAALGGMIAAYGPLNSVLQHLTQQPQPTDPVPGDPPGAPEPTSPSTKRVVRKRKTTT